MYSLSHFNPMLQFPIPTFTGENENLQKVIFFGSDHKSYVALSFPFRIFDHFSFTTFDQLSFVEVRFDRLSFDRMSHTHRLASVRHKLFTKWGHVSSFMVQFQCNLVCGCIVTVRKCTQKIMTFDILLRSQGQQICCIFDLFLKTVARFVIC